MNGASNKIGMSVRERIIDLEQDGKSTILNGFQAPKLTSQKNIFSGQIILYRPGIDIPAIKEDLQSTLKQYEVKQYQVDDEMKPIEGILHFVVYEDHVGLIESSAVRSRWLERYLTWLLKSATDIIDDNSVVELQAKFSTKDGIKPPQNAQHILIPSRPVSNSETTETTTLAKGTRVGGTVSEMLRLLGWKKHEVSKLIESLPEGSNLHGDLKIYAKNGRKNVDFQRQTLDSAFRNTDAQDIILESKNGNQRGGLFKLSNKCNVRKNGALFEPEDATKVIWNQILDWGKNGRIDLKV